MVQLGLCTVLSFEFVKTVVLWRCTLPYLIEWGLELILHHLRRENASIIKYIPWVLEIAI